MTTPRTIPANPQPGERYAVLNFGTGLWDIPGVYGMFDEADARQLVFGAKAVEALTWYGEQSRLARLIHSEGDAGRHAIAGDGGTKARAVLADLEVPT